MSLFSNVSTLGHVTEALIHFNRARDATAFGTSTVDIARAMFDGLNKLQTGWLMDQADQQIGEVKAFSFMISAGHNQESREILFHSCARRSKSEARGG